MYITSGITYITYRYKAHVNFCLNTLKIIHFCYSSFLMQINSENVSETQMGNRIEPEIFNFYLL